MSVVINGTTGITTPGLDASGTNKFAATIGVGGATPAASGAGITFPATQSSSSDANTLDDYEEGTFTPVLNFDSSSSGIVYASRDARYTKVGRVVTIQISMAVTSTGSSSGFATIQGLPFTPAFLSNGNIGGDGITFTGAYLFLLTESGYSQVWIANQTGGTGSLGGWSYTYPALWGSAGNKYMSMTYIAAT